ncbi:MAG: aspartate-semialdehyde dehydrogenase [Chloroherpetonaceae bacterium]|nr:aspartate-semialdehyde dehydrogenase [Chthonomonadaceae bacterium]MDW8208628.1 aspartate-semialdehyde dehydrogenase [Chloroherpetonaceae bacterium]
MRTYHVAIVGATGAVGSEFLRLLETREFPLASLRLLASERSAGRTLPFRGHAIGVERLTTHSFRGVDIAFFSAGGARSREFAPAAVQAGALVIDNSSAFRMDPGVPLVIPEINPEDILHHRGIIANPNCSTILMLMAVAPLRRLAPIRRIVVSTYQAASGAGAQAMQELLDQTFDVLHDRPVTPRIFPYPIAFNLFSHNSSIDATGYNEEERKMIHEARKILHDPALRITATCVRVPVLRAHSESVNVEFAPGTRPTLEQAREALEAFPGVEVVDDREANHFPMPIEASGRHEVLVGRLRYDLSNEDAIDLFLSGDQVLKGAALNAVQIAEKWMHLVSV